MLRDSGNAVLDTALRPLARFLNKRNLVELTVNEPGEVGLELMRDGRNGIRDQGYVWEKAPDLTLEYWEELCHVLANGQGHRFDLIEQPRVSCQLPGGHRYEAMLGKVVSSGISVSVRMKRRAQVGLADFGLIGDPFKRLTELIARGGNVIVSGGTASGKTTFLNLLLEVIPEHRRLFVIEDTAELEVPHKNQTRRLVSRNETGVAIGYAEIFDHAMRSRPDQVLLGELSIPNTYSALRLLNTGHRGFLATIHADSPELALDEAFFQNLAFAGDARMSSDYLSRYLRRTVDAVLQVAKVGGARRAVIEIWWPLRGERWRPEEASL